MSIEERIYEKLRAHSATRKHNIKSAEPTNRDERRARTRGDYQEKFTDFNPTEVKYLLLDEQIAKKYYGMVGAGKEANIYWIKDFEKRIVAVKMFRVHATSHNYNVMHTRKKLSDTAKLGIATGLCKTEYINLHTMYDAGVRVPKPLWRKGFLYGMELLGSSYGAEPLLANINLNDLNIDPHEVMDDILDQIDIMFNKAKMVHGDFSEHNIIWYNDKPWIIDVLQSRVWHPQYATDEKIRKRDALKILKKDIDTILNHFKSKYRISYDPDVVFNNMPDKEINDWMPDHLMDENIDIKAFEKELKRNNI